MSRGVGGGFPRVHHAQHHGYGTGNRQTNAQNNRQQTATQQTADSNTQLLHTTTTALLPACCYAGAADAAPSHSVHASSVAACLHLADLPLPRGTVLGPQVRWSLTGRDVLQHSVVDADRRLLVPMSGVAAAGAVCQTTLELHVVVVLAVRRDLAQRTPFAADNSV